MNVPIARRTVSSRVITGGLIVLVGLLLLLQTTNTYDTAQLWQYVPSVFVLLGLWAIVASGFRNLTGPIVLIIVAGTFQLLALDLLTDEFVGTWWPVLLVVVGLVVLLGRSRRADVRAHAGDSIDLFAAFGGVERRVTSKTFRGGDVVTAFGGAEVDLRDAAVADGEPATIEVFTAFGGTDIYVPDDWNVRLDVLPVFGAAEDERPRFVREDVDTDRVDLVVSGLVAFGGVSIK